jgi:hypothetical protein
LLTFQAKVLCQASPHQVILWSLNKVAHQVPIIDIHHFIPFVNFMFFVNISGQRATLDFSVMTVLPLPSLPTPDHLSFPRQGGSGIIYLKE